MYITQYSLVFLGNFVSFTGAWLLTRVRIYIYLRSLSIVVKGCPSSASRSWNFYRLRWFSLLLFHIVKIMKTTDNDFTFPIFKLIPKHYSTYPGCLDIMNSFLDSTSGEQLSLDGLLDLSLSEWLLLFLDILVVNLFIIVIYRWGVCCCCAALATVVVQQRLIYDLFEWASSSSSRLLSSQQQQWT